MGVTETFFDEKYLTQDWNEKWRFVDSPHFFETTFDEGCQIFLDTIYQNGEKYIYQIFTTLPNYHKIYQLTFKYFK
jgi:hypothetical protein